jgi:hypothetical protein
MLGETCIHRIDGLSYGGLFSGSASAVFAGAVAYICRENKHAYIESQSGDDDQDCDYGCEFN